MNECQILGEHDVHYLWTIDNSPSQLACITFLTYLFRLHRFCNNGFHVRKADLNRIILASFLFGPWPLARSAAAPAPSRHERITINEWASPACRNASLCMLAIIDLVVCTSKVDSSIYLFFVIWSTTFFKESRLGKKSNRGCSSPAFPYDESSLYCNITKMEAHTQQLSCEVSRAREECLLGWVRDLWASGLAPGWRMRRSSRARCPRYGSRIGSRFCCVETVPIVLSLP